MTVVHLVSHTHWDREWYHSATRFRQRLVSLVDELLSEPPESGSFLLDGQTVVLDDYLAVRPERRDALAALLQSRAIEAGPWFVLADALIPSGESLVRNLLEGRRALRALGADAPPVLYCPDSFGHPSALPAIAAGFGLDVVVVWRGFGSERWPQSNTLWWTAPSGERALLYHLSRSGYELGANLPSSDATARTRWAAIAAELLPRANVGVALLLNGADHHARQRNLRAATTALGGALALPVSRYAATPAELRVSSLRAFATSLQERALHADVPLVAGELRDSYGFTWTLQGTLASRAALKRRAACAERSLVRDTEPWVVFAAQRAAMLARLTAAEVADGSARAVSAEAAADTSMALLNAAWRSLLLCHPHDTLCGCSTDSVSRAMDTRLDETETQAEGLRNDALMSLAGYDTDASRARHDAWTPVVVVRNAAPRSRGGVALLRMSEFVRDVAVGPPGAAEVPATDADAAEESARGEPVEVARPRAIAPPDGVVVAQVLAQRLRHERTESARGYPDDDLVIESDVAAWIGPVPAYGLCALEHASTDDDPTPARNDNKRTDIPYPAVAKGKTLSNGRLAVRVLAGGRVSLATADGAREVADLLQWESLRDEGDLYTPSLRGKALASRFRSARVLLRGPVRAALELNWNFVLGTERVDVAVHLILDADAPFLRVHVHGTNRATNHRLRLRLATDVSDARVHADAAFGGVQREEIVVTNSDLAMEQPVRTAPLHRYVTLSNAHEGATLFSDGLAEYEVSPEGGVWVTLLRCVGELSRSDLPERPGHAGWPTATPEAQAPGPFSAELAIALHGARDHRTIHSLEQMADDVLLPLTGTSLRSALRRPDPVHGLALEGEGLAFSAAKPSDDGTWMVLRCVNLTDRSCPGVWTLGAPVAEARLARLDERALEPIATHGDARIPFTAPPYGLVTILAR